MSGKSTLAYFCAKSGYALLSDNSVWMRNARQNRNLLGNPSRLHLRVQARDLFPELGHLPASRHGSSEELLAVPTEKMLSGHVVTEAKPGPFVFLDRREGPASVLRIPSDEAHRRLFLDRNPAVDEPHVMQLNKRVIEETVGAGAFVMRYGTLSQALECLNQVPLSA